MQQRYDHMNSDYQQLLKDKKEMAEKYDDIAAKYSILDKQQGNEKQAIQLTSLYFKELLTDQNMEKFTELAEKVEANQI